MRRMAAAALSAVVVLALAVLSAGRASAQDAPRLSDNDLDALIEDVDHSRDRFEDALDGDFKHSIARGPRGEVQVNQYLDDLQENTNRLKERYTSKYAASAEARTVLQQGSDIQRFMRDQPDSMKGRSEWDRMAGTLGRLAQAYGTVFPLVPDAPVRRINDDEAAAAAEAATKGADAFRKAVGNDKTLAKPQQQALKANAVTFAELSKTVRSRLNDHKPATAEARQMFDAFKALSDAASAAAPSTLGTLGPVRASLETLRQAFGVTAPAGTK